MGAPALEVSRQATSFNTDDAYLKWKGKSRLDWTWKNFDLNTTVTYTDGFHEIFAVDPFFADKKKEHWVKATWFFDVQGSYDFKFAAPIENSPVAGYSTNPKDVVSDKEGSVSQSRASASFPCWKQLLSNTTITVGCNNVFGQDPPFTPFANANYPDFVYDSVGRFIYVSLKKKF